mgnify:CR=1 FL=1|tara:strand:+ start:2146 stop:2586 length:441 start_codon:yes stop_codon:yes gene_type:complete
MTILTDEDRNLLQRIYNTWVPANPHYDRDDTEACAALRELIDRPVPVNSTPTNPAYDSLEVVLKAAFNQAASGKGKERHAGNGLSFTDQPMQTISKLLNTSDGLAFQAIKKVTEAKGMQTFEQKERELLGAINYIAGIIIFEEGES